MPGRSALLPAIIFLLAATPAGALCDAPLPSRGSFKTPASSPVLPHPRTAVLSIDATWSRDGAEQVLHTLSSMKVPATFFLAGRFIRANPDLVLRIVAEGHEIGNHTYSHDHLTRYGIDRSNRSLPGVTAETLTRELALTQEAFESLTGETLSPIWRAPYGETNREILSWASRAGYAHVGWSQGLDTLDWVSDTTHRLYRGPDRGARRVLNLLKRRRASDGPAIILMHLGSDRPEEERFANALPFLVRQARAVGYSFVTAGEALAKPAVR